MMALPVAVEPVNMTLPMAGCAARRLRPRRGRPETAVSTSGGQHLVEHVGQGQHATAACIRRA